MQKFEAGNDQQSGHSMSSSTQPAYAHPPTTINYHPPLPIFIAIVFSILFFFGFFAIYFFKCLLENLFALCNRRRNPSGALVAAANPSMSTGLDPEHIQAFPTFYFSSVKEYRREKYGLECAICLGEFNDDDMLRLLTICCHVFHKECIDLWLESHKTCPVCRGELDVPRNSLDKPPLLARTNSMHELGAHQTSLQDAVCIDIKEDNNEEVGGRESEAQACSSTRIKVDKMKQKFSRSHSTGHSIPRTRDDRYTLRLRDRVKIKIIKGHNSATSCIAFGEFSRPSFCRKEDFGQSSETNPGDFHKVL